MGKKIKNGLILGVMGLVAFTLKKFYQTAEVTDLYWILAPTKVAVHSFTGLEFSYDASQGYINQAHQFVIAKSCAGVNFLIIAFCTSVFGFTPKIKGSHWQWLSLPVFLVIAYLLTVAVNAFRIVNALLLKDAYTAILPANRLHAIEGAIVYLAFLLIYYLLLHYCFTIYKNRQSLTSSGLPNNVTL
ncbi:exosortase K [uncultured Microscilla sp.]|uniref:exosortase K n=1 Tax=uncultured Microscilla sp. TaxID=432653 RepID=UPI002611DB70|nr:exosortase K [uncultured Microscilla sp.]